MKTPGRIGPATRLADSKREYLDVKTRMYGSSNGDDAHDSWQLGRWGFRLDWDVSDQNSVQISTLSYRPQFFMMW